MSKFFFSYLLFTVRGEERRDRRSRKGVRVAFLVGKSSMLGTSTNTRNFGMIDRSSSQFTVEKKMLKVEGLLD
jgi:hypothetical protein